MKAATPAQVDCLVTFGINRASAQRLNSQQASREIASRIWEGSHSKICTFEEKHRLPRLHPPEARVPRYNYLIQATLAAKGMDADEQGKLIGWIRTFKELADAKYWHRKKGANLLADYRRA